MFRLPEPDNLLLLLALTLSLVVIVVSSPAAQSSDQFTKETLENGLVLLHENRSNPPVVAVRLFVPAGSSHDPIDQQGLAYLTARYIAGRTAERGLVEFNRFKSRYGLKINSSTYPDFTVLSFTAITDYRGELLDTIREVLSVNSVDTDLVQHLKKQQLSRLNSRKDRTYTLAMDRALEAFYGDHPYGHPPVGRTDSVKSLEPGDVRDFYQNHYSLNGAVVSAVGDLTLSSFKNHIKSLRLPSEDSTAVTANYDAPSDTRVTLSRDVEQPSHLMLYSAPRVSADSYVATKVLDALLGGGMSSRLFTEMREKRSLGYQVTSAYPSRRLTSTFRVYLGGGDPSGEKFRTALDSIWAELQTEGPSESELDQARDFLKGTFLLNHETPGKTAWYRGFYEILGRGAEFDGTYPDRVDEIQSADVKSAIDRVLGASPLFLTVEPSRQ